MRFNLGVWVTLFRAGYDPFVAAAFTVRMRGTVGFKLMVMADLDKERWHERDAFG